LEHRKTSPLYKIIKQAVRLCYPKVQVIGAENLPKEPSLIVANHAQMNGPIACELYFPGDHYTWCAGEMMHLGNVPEYAFRDFWSNKPKYTHWFYKLLSYAIAPLSVCIFNNANTIGVYRDTRIVSTFKNTVKCLQQGANVIVFPEHDVKWNAIIYDFQDKFIDVAKLYYKRTGKKIAFVPMYIAPARKGMYIGKPVYFEPENQINSERTRICGYLKEEITQIATSLPRHRVVPYKNIPKKDYPYNAWQEGTDEETSC